MGFSLWNLFKVGLLLINSVLILNRKRFLVKHGLDDLASMGNSIPDQSSNPMKAQIAGILHAVQYLKPVIVVANSITIVFELILGGS
mmetsp:Transcript_5028/g.12879  ORF Transcript_5028/g.12879 Transcript_5028/m.12879 type:complete len:87 (+) Transcript_5028:257-517(+)